MLAGEDGWSVSGCWREGRMFSGGDILLILMRPDIQWNAAHPPRSGLFSIWPPLLPRRDWANDIKYFVMAVNTTLN